MKTKKTLFFVGKIAPWLDKMPGYFLLVSKEAYWKAPFVIWSKVDGFKAAARFSEQAAKALVDSASSALEMTSNKKVKSYKTCRKT